MAITTVDQLVAAMGNVNKRSRLPFSKGGGSGGGGIIGAYYSWWRATGIPVQPAIPTNAVTLNASTVGGLGVPAPMTAGDTNYLVRSSVVGTISAAFVEVHDRLAHMGTLSGIVTTAQTVGLDLNALASTDNLAARIGATDYSQLTWWIDIIVATGATPTTVTVSYTNHLGVSGRTTTVAFTATMSILSARQIIPTTNEFIRSVESITLSVSTGTVGNIGVSVTRQLTEIPAPAAGIPTVYDWASLGLPLIADNACLSLMGLASATTFGAIAGVLQTAAG